MSNRPKLLRPDLRAGYVHADAPELDRQLREGDGIFWAGDSRLFLSMGVVEANRRAYVAQLGRYVKKGEIIARRYEVWRHGEDGTPQMIGSWRVEDFDRILVDLAPMRLDAPNRVDTLTAIDEHNAAIEKANTDEIKGSLMEGLEHQVKLWHDRSNPKNVFRGIPGRRDIVESAKQAAATALVTDA